MIVIVRDHIYSYDNGLITFLQLCLAISSENNYVSGHAELNHMNVNYT